MTESFARLRTLRTKEELEEVQRLAVMDQHDVVAPTDLVIKDGKIVGYLSIMNLPLVMGHFSTTILRARDSFNLIHIAEQVVERSGWKSVAWPIGIHSPFHQLFPEMGYKRLANVDLFAKEF